MAIRKIKDNNDYWTNIIDLQSSINDKELIELNDAVKSQIIHKIKASITDNNYLISKLLIYGQVNKEILLNFLFYISVNTTKLYILFVEDTDKFCRKFMFNIAPQELPNINKYFTKVEIQKLRKLIDLPKMIHEVENCSNESLKSLFPKSYKHNIKTNPFIKDDKL